MSTVLNRADVNQGLARLERNVLRVIEDGIAISEVPAPTFQEGRRGEFVSRRMQALGLPAPRTDAEGNVICEMPGDAGRGTVVVMAHLDTVFGVETPLKVRREGSILYGPGIGDNSMAVAGMLWLGEALRDLPNRGSLVLAANVGEEGLGNLRGAKALWEQYHDRATAWIALEGAMSAEVVNLGIPSRRLQIAYRGPGGHSWRDFGRPSSIHALGSLIDQVAQIRPPSSPRTTYNIGGISGGRSVNTIAQDAELVLDMRSEDATALGNLERQVRGLITAIGDAAGMRSEITVVGDRPGGRLPDGHWLAGIIDTAATELGMKLRWKSASTDGNVPLSHGAPAVTLGIAKGDNLHALDEFLDVTSMLPNLKLDYLVLASALLRHRE